jgi:hypothetical protein
MTKYYEYDIIIKDGKYIVVNPIPIASNVKLAGSGATPNILGDHKNETFTVSKHGEPIGGYTYVGNTTSVLDPALQGLIGKDAAGNLVLFLPNNGTPGIIEGVESFIASSQKDDPNNPATQWNIKDGAPQCFLEGTRIMTPTGQVLVETLVPGDLVLTAAGQAAPVLWLGQATISRLFSDPLKVMPIRILANALAEGLPQRDLLLSPDHAVLIDGVLVQAAALENGLSVTRETRMPLFFTYYHIELADHALVLAEGVAAETFIDNVDRFSFDNWEEHEALVPDCAPIEEMSYPRAQARRQIPTRTLERLAERAETVFGYHVAAA